MELTERQAEILECAVAEYIETAEPVSSQSMEKRYRFGISPATLRNEMKTLSDEGFLYQPHTSAGRIPTEKGYRFFVNTGRVGAHGEDEKRAEFLALWHENAERNEIQAIWELARGLASHSSNLVVASLTPRRIIIKEGWKDMVQEPEFEERSYLIDFANFLETIERNMEPLYPAKTITVYIGKENPWARSEEFSVVAASCAFGGDTSGTIAMVGPMRMEYQKNIHLMGELLRALS